MVRRVPATMEGRLRARLVALGGTPGVEAAVSVVLRGPMVQESGRFARGSSCPAAAMAALSPRPRLLDLGATVGLFERAGYATGVTHPVQGSGPPSVWGWRAGTA